MLYLFFSYMSSKATSQIGLGFWLGYLLVVTWRYVTRWLECWAHKHISILTIGSQDHSVIFRTFFLMHFFNILCWEPRDSAYKNSQRLSILKSCIIYFFNNCNEQKKKNRLVASANINLFTNFSLVIIVNLDLVVASRYSKHNSQESFIYFTVFLVPTRPQNVKPCQRFFQW